MFCFLSFLLFCFLFLFLLFFVILFFNRWYFDWFYLFCCGFVYGYIYNRMKNQIYNNVEIVPKCNYHTITIPTALKWYGHTCVFHMLVKFRPSNISWMLMFCLDFRVSVKAKSIIMIFVASRLTAKHWEVILGSEKE